MTAGVAGLQVDWEWHRLLVEEINPWHVDESVEREQPSSDGMSRVAMIGSSDSRRIWRGNWAKLCRFVLAPQAKVLTMSRIRLKREGRAQTNFNRSWSRMDTRLGR